MIFLYFSFELLENFPFYSKAVLQPQFANIQYDIYRISLQPLSTCRTNPKEKQGHFIWFPKVSYH